ncbi:MAG: hypothetical protein FWG92_03755 [Leptospirales bacterium]|nr:hypothetical protein [Leptospirales bacterium]
MTADLKKLANKLAQETAPDKQVKILQEIMTELLHKYAIKIKDNFVAYPIHAEAYYYHKNNFPDSSVHQNELQQNNFGKLYFHRARKSKTKEAKFKDLHTSSKIGVDICLSDSDDFFLGILIKDAWINNEDKPVGGQAKLVQRIIGRDKDERLNSIDKKMSHKEKDYLRELENRDLLITSADEKRKITSVSFKKRDNVSGAYKEELLKAILG